MCAGIRQPLQRGDVASTRTLLLWGTADTISPPAVGEHLAAWLADHLGVRAVVIPNGVGPIAPTPLAAAGVPGLRSGEYLLYLGRLRGMGSAQLKARLPEVVARCQLSGPLDDA